MKHSLSGCPIQKETSLEDLSFNLALCTSFLLTFFILKQSPAHSHSLSYPTSSDTNPLESL